MAKPIKHQKITLRDGTAAVLSLAQLSATEFEVMLASPDYEQEYKVLRTTSERQALSDFDHLRKTYHVPPLTGKYLKLSQDLKAAAEAGRKAAAASDDGGTCNFDSAALYLPRWQAAKVEQAANAAGLGCFKWSLVGAYVFPLSVSAQGNARTAAAEAMEAHLKAAGYDATVYYQID